MASLRPVSKMHFNITRLVLLFLPFILSASAVTVVTKEELAEKVGKEGDELWLSILGEVYDVSKGGTYYAEGGPYSVFMGRDGSVPFITGVFTEEEAAKSLSVLEPEQLYSLENWRDFYRDDDKYPFVGLLVGELYDKDGNPTQLLTESRGKMAEAKVVADERKKKRDAVIAQRKKEREEKQKAEAAAGGGDEL